MEKGSCVNILTNFNTTVVYIGITSDLLTRLQEHKLEKYPNSFSAKYQLKYCVYHGALFTIEESIGREKQIKKWA